MTEIIVTRKDEPKYRGILYTAYDEGLKFEYSRLYGSHSAFMYNKKAFERDAKIAFRKKFGDDLILKYNF